MRTTLDLPAEVLREAKVTAATEGITLKEFVSRALIRELKQSLESPGPRRVEFPVVKSKEPGILKITNEDIRRIELEEDLHRLGMMPK